MKTKNIFLTLLLVSSILTGLKAQHTLIVNGLVSNNNGVPIQVYIEVDLNTTHVQNSNILTDSSGHYADTFTVNYSQGSVTAWIVDCNGDTVKQHGGYYINHMTVTLNLDFCATPANSCTALFSKVQAHNQHQQPIPYLIHIVDHSSGNNLSYLWHFGDGDSSTAHNPTHTYAGHGPYVLCLTVSNAHCMDTYCDTISIDSNGTLKSGQGFSIIVGGNIPTEIESIVKDDISVKLFPNPAKDKIFIFFESTNIGPVNIYLRDELGRTIFVEELVQSSEQTIELEIGSLKKGFHFIQIENNDKRTAFKFIKN